MMDRFLIEGGARLCGEVTINGAKNSALPIMAATLLTTDETVLHSLPTLADVHYFRTLLGQLGATVIYDNKCALHIKVEDESYSTASYEIVRRMRASICVLGPLLARRGRAEVSLPGGCAIGDRPINLHIRGLEALGAKIHLERGNVIAECPRLRGAKIFLGSPCGSTVLGTANIMTAATLAQGSTIIEAAACEPEIVDLGDFLNCMGARIAGHGTPRITIEGVDKLYGCEHRIIPDRIEAGTFMVAAAITNGELTVKNCRTEHLTAVIDGLRRIGVDVEGVDNTVRVKAARRLNPVDLTTQPFPGFPTDLQAQITVLLCFAYGNSVITEQIFPDRFMHVPELNRMGANLRKEGPSVIVAGVRKLVGAPVMASDLRASAALILAGLAAEGQTILNRVYHIDRGYEKIEYKLNLLGANITREAV